MTTRPWFGRGVKAGPHAAHPPAELDEEDEVQPTQPAEVQPTQPAEVQPTQLDEVQPTQPAEVQPTQPVEVQPTQLDEMQPTQLDEVQPLFQHPPLAAIGPGSEGSVRCDRHACQR